MSYSLYVFVIRLCENSCPARGGSPKQTIVFVSFCFRSRFSLPASRTWDPCPFRNSSCKRQAARDREQGEGKEGKSKRNIPSARSGHRPSTLQHAQDTARSKHHRLRASREIGVVPIFWERLKQNPMLSSQLFSGESDTDMFFYFLDIIENTLLECNLNFTAKLW